MVGGSNRENWVTWEGLFMEEFFTGDENFHEGFPVLFK